MKTQAPKTRGVKVLDRNHAYSHAGAHTISFSDNEILDTERTCNSESFFFVSLSLSATPNIFTSTQLSALRLLTLDYNHLSI